MRKFLCLLIIGLLSVIPIKVFAAERVMTITPVLSTASGLIQAGEVALYGFSYDATAAGASIGFYDNLTNSQTAADQKAEQTEAIQFDGDLVWFPEPVLFDTGFFVRLKDMNVILYYRK